MKRWDILQRLIDVNGYKIDQPLPKIVQPAKHKKIFGLF